MNTYNVPYQCVSVIPNNLESACACVHAKLLPLFPTLCDPIDCSLPGSSVHRILQAGTWSGLLCSPPGHLPDPEIELTSLISPALAGGFFISGATWEVQKVHDDIKKKKKKKESNIVCVCVWKMLHWILSVKSLLGPYDDIFFQIQDLSILYS